MNNMPAYVEPCNFLMNEFKPPAESSWRAILGRIRRFWEGGEGYLLDPPDLASHDGVVADRTGKASYSK
jgi:hypothetical protein